MKCLAVVILALACMHEFSWQAMPWDMQGNWRMVTQWPLTVAICLAMARLGRSPYLSAAALATSIMTSTTAACSTAYLIRPWVVGPGEEQCSKHWGLPMLMVSAVVALVCLARWTRVPP